MTTGERKACDKPPAGWWCSRPAGHDGPCAARREYTDPQPAFSLYKEQREEAVAWREKHIKEKHKGKHPYAGAIGGAFGWKFIGTGLGTIAIYYCMCGEEVNVTDFDNW